MTAMDKSHSDKKQPAKRLATFDHPLIGAIAEGLFRFVDKEQAMRRINELRNEFVVAKEQKVEGQPYNLKLWIKDYALSEGEIKQGYRGHFAGISIIRLENGKYSLAMTKIEVPLNLHPQKTRPRRSHPDWGHPVLRQLEKNPVFDDVEKARAMLMALHEEYPNISIPGMNHLFIMIYSKDYAKSDAIPVKKYKFTITSLENGKFQITHQENIKKKNPVVRTVTENAEKPAEGRFTAMIKLKRKKKRM